MKTIFLDIDGVLNRTPCVPTGAPRIDHKLALRLNQIIQRTGAGVVISSTWRNWTALGWISLHGWECLFGTHGVDCQVCGVLSLGDKVLALKWWLDSHKPSHFVVLDDVRLHPRRQVKTDGRLGLTQANVEEAVRILGELSCP